MLSCTLAACGSETRTTPSTTTTTTVPDELAEPLAAPADAGPTFEDADLAAGLLARTASLATSDFAPGWTEERPAGPGATGPGSCSSPADRSRSDPLAGVAYRGPTMGLDDAPAHVTSAAHVFADDAAAQRWIEIVRSEEWPECRVRSFDGALEERDAPARMEVGSRDHPQLGAHGFEAYTELRGTDDRGALAFAVHVLHHRRGPVVIESTLERSIELSESQWRAVDDAHSAALATAWARVSAATS